ncbi:hypothetical protein [Actinoplanes ianthinogenes]|nr:hypothetical protein [Actinoplanes ianthinogenes]
MTPSPEALTWQRRADAWAQQSQGQGQGQGEIEPYAGGGGQAVEPANRWSDVTSTGRPTFPADGTGWRTQTSEWRATGARWRQTTEWRSSTGSHVWRSTTEAWQSENEAEATPARPTISGTSWPTTEQESAGRESWSDTPSWRREADTGRAATTPVEQTWSSGSSTPSWQRPSAQTPSWQQPSTQAPSWQQPSTQTPSWQQPAAPTPSWQQPAGSTPSWQRPAAESWSSSAPVSDSWSADRRGATRGENTTDIGGWDQRSDGPGWQAGPRDDGRHFVRKDDRAAWQRGAETEWSTRRGRRRAPEPEVPPTGGSGWSTTSDTDNWAGHTDTGNIALSPTSPTADQGAPAPSWGSRSARRGQPAEPEGYSDAYGAERTGQTPIRYGVRPESSTRLSRRAAPDDGPVAFRDEGAAASGGLPERHRGPAGLPERQRGAGSFGDESPAASGVLPARQRGTGQFGDESTAASGGVPGRQRGAGQFGDESAAASGGMPARQRGAGRRAQQPQRYNANPTNWREDTSSWEAEPDTSNWTRDPDTGQWSRAEDDPRVLAWRAEAARRERIKDDGAEPQPEQPGWGGEGRRGRRADEPTGPVGGVPGGPLPSSGMPDGPRPRSAMPSSGGTWSTGAAMPGPATPRSAGAPWNGAEQPDPYTSGRFRTDQYPPDASRQAYGNDTGARRRAPEPEPEAWPSRSTGRDEYQTEGWRQGPLPPRQDPPRELPAGRSGGWAEPGYPGQQRELPAGRSTWPEPERGVPRQTGYGSLPPEDSGWAEREPEPRRTGGPGYGYGPSEDDGRSWADLRRPGGARELPAGGPSYGARELPAAPQRRDDGYGMAGGDPAWRDPRKPAYGAQRELPGGPSSWTDPAAEAPGYDETDRYGNPRRRDDRDDPPYGGGGGGARGQGDWRAPGPSGGASWNGGSGPVNGWNGAGPGNGSYRRGAPDPGYSSGGAPEGGGWRASADTDAPGGSAAPVSGSAGYRATAAPGGDWRQELNGGGSAAPVSGYRATATPPGDWRAELNGGAPAGPTAVSATGSAPVVSSTPGADWRAELTGGTAAPTSGAAGYRAAAGGDWRADLSAAPTSGAAAAAGTTGYRATAAAAAPATGDWRRELNADLTDDGEAQRFSTSDFPSFRPSGSAAVAGRENLALSATSVITATPGEAGEDTSWPPRRAVSGALFESTGSYERRPVSSGVLSGRQSDLLNPDDEEEEETSNSPLAAVGYTVVWYGVPVVLFVLGMLLLNTGQRAHALQTLADAAPEFGISLALSIVVAFGLRFATTAWKSASVGLAAAVVGGGLATVLSSAITGNSLS